jgi:hypothetical protein
VKAVLVALLALALPVAAQAQDGADDLAEPAGGDEVAEPVEEARVAEPPGQVSLAVTDWPSSPLAPTDALNPRVERSIDLGLVITGATIVALAYFAKAVPLAFLDRDGRGHSACGEQNIALTLIPFLGGPIGAIHSFTCSDGYQTPLREAGEAMGILWATAAAADLTAAAFLIAGIIGGEGVVVDPPTAGSVRLHVGAGSLTVSGAF